MRGRIIIAIGAICIIGAASAPAQTAAPADRGWVRGRDLEWSPFATLTNLVPRYHAIVIGINDYDARRPQAWEPLSTARQDAEAVANVLERQYHFEVRRLFDRQATRAAIMQTLDGLASLGGADAVLIYFAGHGVFDPKLGEGFWIPCDARKKDGAREPTEDWSWNTTLSKILGASEARHVLVVADSCYAGSLFRGDELAPNQSDQSWYRRALVKPSRYLISSGDLEPVLDNGAGHSVFATVLLNYLQYGDRPVFSASEMGLALRDRVSTLAGQMVRMGPLALPSHAGGEFVFLRPGATLPEAAPAPAVAAAAATRGAEPALSGVARDQALGDAMLMNSQGATNAARNLLRAVLNLSPEDGLARAVAAYVDQDRRARDQEELRQLIGRIEAARRAGRVPGPPAPGYAAPRILAWLGPQAVGGDAAAEAQALLYRIGLRAAFERLGGLVLVERENLQDILREMNLGVSDLAAPDARTAVGRLLPASLLLVGDWVPQADGGRLFLRLVDTETTRVLGSYPATADQDGDVLAVSERLAAQIQTRALEVRPQAARVFHQAGSRLRAGVGALNGVQPGRRFELVEKTGAAPGPPTAAGGEVIGSAHVVAVADSECDLDANWRRPVSTNAYVTLWVRPEE